MYYIVFSCPSCTACIKVKSSGIVKDIGGGKRESEDTDDYPPAKKKPR